MIDDKLIDDELFPYFWPAAGVSFGILAGVWGWSLWGAVPVALLLGVGLSLLIGMGRAVICPGKISVAAARLEPGFRSAEAAADVIDLAKARSARQAPASEPPPVA